ncbi:MAG: cupin domain-containing protein, partial [Pseudomonadota bacterium]
MAAPAGLANAWQREPWWTNNQEAPFEPPMDLDEIAGLATYADVESLLIATSHANGRTEYRIQHGPFTPSTLASLGDRDWTLLVRDIDRHLPELTGLWQQFDWLADYRRADIMVSVAAPGGSVGPHSDSYDVFLVQGHGRRIWQLAPGDTAEVVPDHPLRLAYPAHFEQEIVADPGATLYVPPGYIHHGVAQTLCTTWSFGLQAPLLADLAAVAGIDIPSSEGQRLADQKLPVRERSGEIPNDAIRTL